MQNVLVTDKGEKGPVAARLFVILARKSHSAVIFRRGPSRWVQLIKWNTDSDTFELGQWFHGRVYERRCDLTPDGAYLVYFAQKISARSLKDKEYTYAWTAISKPPYWTALALWPKGDCWNGGGLFTSNRSLALYHLQPTEPHPEHKPARWLRVRLSGCCRGEDDPIFSDRLERDGWTLQQEWKIERLGYPKMFRTIQPEVLDKRSPSCGLSIRLTRSIQGTDRSLDYSEEFAVLGLEHAGILAITRASWVDWDQNGRLVFCRDGKVFAARIQDGCSMVEKELADFNSLKPTPLPPPEKATRW